MTTRPYIKRGSGLQITPVQVKAPPDPKKFGRGKRTPRQNNDTFGGVTVVDTDESEDEIMIVSEKITPKAKMRVQMRQQRGRGRGGMSLGFLRGRGRGGNFGSRGGGVPTRGRGVSRPTGSVPVTKKPEAKVEDAFGDDDDLTCRVCLSSFWYKNQVVEHLQAAHSVKDPETFLREKKRTL